MRRAGFGFLFLVCAMGWAGCSQSTTSRCPPEFPVERDGFCYAAEGGAMLDGGGIATDGGGGGTDTGGSDLDGGGGGTDTGPGVDAGPTDAAVICVGEHPLVMGTRRYCNPGDCFCADPDSCFPSDIASACCTVPVVCDDGDGGTTGTDASAVICVGEHPLVMGTRRYCNPGDCFCATPDACFPMDVASACCTVAVVCE